MPRLKSRHSSVFVSMAMAAAVAGTSQHGDAQDLEGMETTEGRTTSREQYELHELREAQIIGALGKPIGTFCSVRGVWKRHPERFKVTEWYFHVTHVDDEEIANVEEYPIFQIRETTGGGQEPLGRPEEGDVWELRVYEGIRTHRAPVGYFDEAGIPAGSGAGAFHLASELRYVRGISLGIPDADSTSEAN